jgi:hypothetical protein
MVASGYPAGWYSDPAARHEQRYWDGTRWTGHILDSGLAGEDPAAIAAVWGASAIAPTAGYRAVRFASWRYLIALFAILTLVLALSLEIGAFVWTAAATPYSSSDAWLWTWSWLYKPAVFRPGSGYSTMAVGFPPVALWPALIFALVGLGGVPYGSRSVTLMRAGAPVARFWSSFEDKQRWTNAQYRLEGAGVSHTVRYRTRDRVYLILAELGSLVVIVVSWIAISGRVGTSTTGDVVSGLSVGFGPYFCFAAGILGALAALIVWPWGHQHEILIHPDGTVDTLS